MDEATEKTIDPQEMEEAVQAVSQLQRLRLDGLFKSLQEEKAEIHKERTELLQANEELQGTLKSMQTATDAVKLKIANLIFEKPDPNNMSWTNLTATLALILEDHQRRGSQLTVLTEALAVVRQRICSFREALLPHLPTTFLKSEDFDPAEAMKVIAAQFDENEEEVTSLKSRVQSLQEDLASEKREVEYTARKWRAEYIQLAKEVGVPNSICGDIKDVHIDNVMNYVRQVMPAYKLLRRIDELEKEVESRFERVEDRLNSISFKPAPEKRKVTNLTTCPVCGENNPRGVVFCACCGTDLLRLCSSCAHTGEDCARDEDGTCDKYESGKQKVSDK